MKRAGATERSKAEQIRNTVAVWVPVVKYIAFEAAVLILFAYTLWAFVTREVRH